MKPIHFIQLMGPPGTGKSTLGAELNRRGIASYTELEPALVRRYGRGEAFAQRRQEAHEWIWNFYRQRLAENPLPVVMETTGMSGRAFLTEISATHGVMLVKLLTPRCTCVSRVLARPKGRHVNDQDANAIRALFDYWHRVIEPTYAFHLSVSGTDLISDVEAIRARIG